MLVILVILQDISITGYKYAFIHDIIYFIDSCRPNCDVLEEIVDNEVHQLIYEYIE